MMNNLASWDGAGLAPIASFSWMPRSEATKTQVTALDEFVAVTSRHFLEF
jgi:hypothetical protein